MSGSFQTPEKVVNLLIYWREIADFAPLLDARRREFWEKQTESRKQAKLKTAT